MFEDDTIYDNAFGFLGGQPLQSEEIEQLHLPPDTIRRLRYLLEQEKQGKITPLECFQLNAFKEAAFFLRMGSRRDT
ncbi:MAG: hypothetical protein ACLFTK_17610 [Anaerolineales bacterium]